MHFAQHGFCLLTGWKQQDEIPFVRGAWIQVQARLVPFSQVCDDALGPAACGDL